MCHEIFCFISSGPHAKQVILMPWNILLPILPIQMFRKLSCASLAKNLVTLYQLNTLFPGRAQYWPPKLLYTVKFPRYNAKCRGKWDLLLYTKYSASYLVFLATLYLGKINFLWDSVYYCRQEAGGVLQEAAHLPLRQSLVGGREAGNPDPLLSFPLKNQQ